MDELSNGVNYGEMKAELQALRKKLEDMETRLAGFKISSRPTARRTFPKRLIIASISLMVLAVAAGVLWGQGAIQALFVDDKGNVSVAGNLNVPKDAAVTGHLTAASAGITNLLTAGSANVTDSLKAGSVTVNKGLLTAEQGLSVTGDATISGKINGGPLVFTIGTDGREVNQDLTGVCGRGVPPTRARPSPSGGCRVLLFMGRHDLGNRYATEEVYHPENDPRAYTFQLGVDGNQLKGFVWQWAGADSDAFRYGNTFCWAQVSASWKWKFQCVKDTGATVVVTSE
jgi:hypothetical protein